MSDLETFDCVRWYDPEIVRHNANEVVGRYSTGRDMATLEIPPESSPVIFTCRVLTRTQRRMVRNQSGDAAQFDLAFRFGVQSIRNLPTPTGPRTVQPSRSRPGEPITDDGMDALGLSEDDEQEIGMVIRTRSFLGRGVPLSCPQLASSLHAFSVVAVHHAELRRARQTQTDDPSG